MDMIDDIAALEALYGTPAAASQVKVATKLTDAYRRWIMASRFCVVSTVGPDGTDGSPRGDDGPVVRKLDPKTRAMPDWRGNNRMDTLRNIVADGRISLMFMVPGSNTVVRVNGMAKVTVDADLCKRFENRGQHPRSVIVIRIGEIYCQCARAPMRARLWSGEDESVGLPTAGDFLRSMNNQSEEFASYDEGWAARAKDSLW